jgi:hypothetical protein
MIKYAMWSITLSTTALLMLGMHYAAAPPLAESEGNRPVDQRITEYHKSLPEWRPGQSKDIGKPFEGILYYDRMERAVKPIGEPKMIFVIFDVTPNHDRFNDRGQQPEQILCEVPENDPVLQMISKWPTGGQTLRVKLTGIVRDSAPGTPGDASLDIMPTQKMSWLHDCAFQRMPAATSATQSVQTPLPDCAVWTDSCVACRATREGGSVCNNIGIACQPKELMCLLDSTARTKPHRPSAR